jgi:FAD/FMN-containing dehydrogenase
MLAGWGQHPLVPAHEVRSENLERIVDGRPLSRGLGRSYGDSSLPAAGDREVVSTTLADRILAFDESTGVMRAEAGLSLHDIYYLLLPRGWFVPVTPGTQFVTLGGMVAADVHGGNHHVDGCFGTHVSRLRMRLASGRIVECSRTEERELFLATVGGMGLTGHILEVEFRMTPVSSPWLWGESEQVPSIEKFVEVLARDAAGWPFTKGWIDCVSRGRSLGRGIMYRARWATAAEAPARAPTHKGGFGVPINLPSWLVNRVTTRIYNGFRYRTNARRPGIVHPDIFFYPLDGIRHWNRLFGRRGFTQYQCVIPHEAGARALVRIMELITQKGVVASPVCVIKDCGPEGEGMLSFPKKGMSLAIDFPVRAWTQRVVDELNDLVIAQGGRIYLAKDAFTRAEHFRAMEPRLDEFLRVRRLWDPEGRFRSAQSARLFGDLAGASAHPSGATAAENARPAPALPPPSGQLERKRAS